MRKNKLYLLSSILIIIFVCATAVTCNLCGNPIEITVPEEETTVEKPEQENQATTQAESQSTEAAVEDNHPPEIREIEMMGMDVEYAVSEGYFDEIPVEAIGDVNFTIEAYDEDVDELQYSAFDSLGNSFEVTKIDNNNAEFSWELLPESGSYTLTIEVSDNRGGTDSQSIDMNFVLPVFEYIEPENHPPEITGEILIENLPGIDSPPGGPYVVGGYHYRISVEAVDPDGDLLIYGWGGGGPNGFSDTTVNPTEWITPDTAATYSIYVLVRDGRGGRDEATLNVRVE